MIHPYFVPDKLVIIKADVNSHQLVVKTAQILQYLR